MAQVTLVPPDSNSKLPNTRDESKEGGWSFKRIIDAINTMFGEIYTWEAAIDAAQAAQSPLQFVDVTITSAELLALNATPKTIVAAPGADLALIFDGAVAIKPAGTAYAGIAGGEDLAIKYTDASGIEVAEFETTGFLDQATKQVRYAFGYRAASLISSITPVENAPLVAHLLSGEITTGDSDLNLRVYYRVVPTTL